MGMRKGELPRTSALELFDNLDEAFMRTLIDNLDEAFMQTLRLLTKGNTAQWASETTCLQHGGRCEAIPRGNPSSRG